MYADTVVDYSMPVLSVTATAILYLDKMCVKESGLYDVHLRNISKDNYIHIFVGLSCATYIYTFFT